MNWTSAQQQALLTIIQRRNERDILLNQLTQTKIELEKQQHQQTALQSQWQHEQADVDRLDRLSWASLFYDLINHKEQQRSKEEAEANQVRLRYDAICAAVTELQHVADNRQKRLFDYSHVDADYQQLIQKKRFVLAGNSDGLHEQYQQHLITFTQSNRYLQELHEAHQAGLQALNEVMQLRKLLDQAHDWGTWDILGGSTLSSMVKYQKLDDVRDQSHRVGRSLQQFKSEYADLNQAFMADWQFNDNLTRFVDIFFDNIFTDWSVQSRINNARQTAQALENQLVSAITALKSQVEQSVSQTRQEADNLQHFLETV